MKLPLVITLILFSQAAFSERYTGCEDPKYISYVEQRLSFYEKLNRESYDKSLKDLETTSFESLNDMEKHLFLFSNTVLSARFDLEEVALRNISRFKELEAKNPIYANSGDMPHLINIAQGWMALNSGNVNKAVHHLLESTKTKGSAVLGSFGPDKTLIRALYKQGNKNAVLEYLKLSELFWNTEGAKNETRIWRKMIKNDCSIQFQFYDTTSIEGLGL